MSKFRKTSNGLSKPIFTTIETQRNERLTSAPRVRRKIENLQDGDTNGGREEIVEHVPQEVGEPVGRRSGSADELQVFGPTRLFGDQEDQEAGGDEGHGDDDEDRDHHVRAGQQEVQRQRSCNTKRTLKKITLTKTYFEKTKKAGQS